MSTVARVPPCGRQRRVQTVMLRPAVITSVVVPGPFALIVIACMQRRRQAAAVRFLHTSPGRPSCSTTCFERGLASIRARATARGQRVIRRDPARRHECPDLIRIDATWLSRQGPSRRCRASCALDWLPEATLVGATEPTRTALPRRSTGGVSATPAEAPRRERRPRRRGPRHGDRRRIRSASVDGYWLVPWLRARAESRGHAIQATAPPPRSRVRRTVRRCRRATARGREAFDGPAVERARGRYWSPARGRSPSVGSWSRRGARSSTRRPAARRAEMREARHGWRPRPSCVAVGPDRFAAFARSRRARRAGRRAAAVDRWRRARLAAECCRTAVTPFCSTISTPALAAVVATTPHLMKGLAGVRRGGIAWLARPERREPTLRWHVASCSRSPRWCRDHRRRARDLSRAPTSRRVHARRARAHPERSARRWTARFGCAANIISRSRHSGGRTRGRARRS